MTEIYSKEQKLEWFGEGPWIDEDDEEFFEHNGVKCHIKRIVAILYDGMIYGGHWCGYACIEKEHPLFNKKEYFISDAIECYFGISFDETKDNERWIGIDFAHCFDLVPSSRKRNNNYSINLRISKFVMDNSINPKATYKDKEFAKQRTMELADEISRVGRELKKENSGCNYTENSKD